jgi:ATP-dependent helicase YprA (DUF1998 family)
MSIFEMHGQIIDEYRRYVQSFLSIADERAREFTERALLEQNALWPDALLQVNPAYEMATTVEALVRTGSLAPLCADIFRTDQGDSIRLYRHQQEAIQRALQRDPFVVTSGTGSGKSLTYFLPIFDAVLRGKPQEAKVWAIVVYPMNALVNSQYNALQRLEELYKTRTGRELPIRFAKYTGQESENNKQRLQQQPPHLLLTNYVMLELVLVRPREHAFVDRTTTGLQFLVVDELHTYRGRQGADVALLIRRLRERCGNPHLLCIGTSATMVAGSATTPHERRQAVADFASKLFGVQIHRDHVIEETLRRVTSMPGTPAADELRQALQAPLPTTLEQIVQHPLTAWTELTFGLEQETGGHLRRRTPISLTHGAAQLAAATGLDPQACQKRLQELLLVGSRLKTPDGASLLAFKLHQFITQGRTIYATLAPAAIRELTMAGQYYAAHNGTARLLFPLLFCRVCGQDYYAVLLDDDNGQLRPYERDSEMLGEGRLRSGYVFVENEATAWSPEHLPVEWLEPNGRVKRDYRPHVPQALWVSPDGRIALQQQEGASKMWFQLTPFLLCLNCGEFYTRRDKYDFRKLTGLSSEGRSTATTVLSVSALRHTPVGEITDAARKLLSFTDNRQDASLQAGHFNDFVQVSLLRAAINAALEQQQQLRFDTIAEHVVSAMGLTLRDVAANPDLDPETAQGYEVWETFRALTAYRIYEDLRRGWRVVQPNLEQCGLLRLAYDGLDTLCYHEQSWEELPPLKSLTPERRQEILTAVLDHFRRKLAIYVDCLQEQPQQQLRRRVQQHLNEQWGLDDTERLRTATRFLLPGQNTRAREGLSLAENSLIGRYLRRTLRLSEQYTGVIERLIARLSAHGLLRKSMERQVEVVQLDASALIWGRGDGTPPPPDPIYSRRATSPVYAEVQARANAFFRNFYQQATSVLHRLEGREHTAQIAYPKREDRERRFRAGELACLFCSPTMELGIDIADLQLVHLRNVPPTPANYAQRSGRAGRQGDPALVFTYCSAGSGHDQYFFQHREHMVAGAVRPPRIDLGNEDLLRAHVHAIWLARVGCSLERSITDILELDLDGYPLKESVNAQTHLSETRLQECLAEARRILQACEPVLATSGWYSEEWLESVVRRAPDVFNATFDRWRELYRAAMTQLQEAQSVFLRSRDRQEQAEARRRVDEANRQRNLLGNIETSREESDFYPYRYLASEGFLPGYNFPRLPIRAFVPRDEGEFISRPRFLAITEFGPQNIVYHEGTKYQVHRLIAAPGGLEARRSQAKLCRECGYFQSDARRDLCEHCATPLDAANSDIVPLLEMPNVKTWRRERITCDEEERRRWGYDVSTHFRFAPAPGGQLRALEGVIYDAGNTPLLRLVYAPAATLYRINHGWRNSRDKGFLIDLATGEWLARADMDDEEPPPPQAQQPDKVRLVVHDTLNLLLLAWRREDWPWDDRVQATLQYALQRGIEQLFQIEEAELAVERIGSGRHQTLLFWEAAEGGVGVLRRLIEEGEAIAQVAQAALERCHFDPQTLTDYKPECAQACYECLLSYTNQRDYARLNRHLVRDILMQLSHGRTHPRQAGRDYEAQYRWLRSLTDSRSDLERRLVDHLYGSKRRLPDEAQKPLHDYASIPDFFYAPNVCVFCDGTVHDEPQQREKDRITRQDLKERGYRVVVIRYDRDLEEQASRYMDIFGEGSA